ncbi:unnamed protein product [Alopecurus aequalis]
MSLITDDPDESPRHCAAKHRHHHHHGTGCRIGGTGRRRLLIAASSATTSLIALAIILWLTLRPSSPRFTLLAATVSGPNATTTAGIVRLDAAFVAHNPNARATALYDRLQLRASYGAGSGVVSQLAAAPLPPFEQTEGDIVLSATLAPTASVSAVAEAEAEGGRSTTTLLRLRVEGQLRWKVAAWVSGKRAIVAECVAVVVLQPSPVQPSRAVVVQGSQCATTIQ